ncbi:hypothetical protein Lpp77_08322 [Lacticaseibacillus paracasei subsp. paracasei CNCM I-4270]|uniref:Uncharacterized protein n=1 Tax=Lacticaseibacillus paracasei subsp. paracasei CNCM I-4270 TaxID=1256202 RepID=A0A8E0IK29_LACPA|nr:hypothetical protein Lpp77_08322 [Lacticaseibacillus paracasei subsp. paracasei CNCM I-4270]
MLVDMDVEIAELLLLDWVGRGFLSRYAASDADCQHGTQNKTKLVFKFILKSFLIHGGGLAEQITLSKA